jgi:hypothetical protein
MKHQIPRQQAFDILDGERNYQDSRWNENTTSSGGVHTPAEWILFMQNYLQEAQQIVTRESDNRCHDRVMAIIRKVGAMAVAAIEQNGAPYRADISTS